MQGALIAQGVLEGLWALFRGSWVAYAIAFGAILLSFVLRKLMVELVIRRLRRLTRSTSTEFDDLVLEALRRPLKLACVALGLQVAVIALVHEFGDPPAAVVDESVALVLRRALGVLWIVIMGWVGLNLCDVVGRAIARLTERTETKLDDMLVPIVRRSLKLFVGLIAFILIVQNLGYPIGALLAGFSIGGLAFALASQDTLQNCFGSVMIFVDRPFQVGDWIKFGDIEGVVEEVGFRSTRIRTFAKTLITVPNSKVAHEAINNYSRMPKRRVAMTIGIGYGTEPERVEAVLDAFRRILSEDERIAQDFWLVNFTEFGDSALGIFLYYFTKTTNWAEFLRVKEELNLRFMRALETLGVEIAFPSRTVYLREDKLPEPPPLQEAARVLNPEGSAPPAPMDADGEDDG